MLFFVLIVVSIVLADVTWWRWGDRRLRRTRHPRVWRPLLGLWTGLMLGYLAFLLAFPQQGRNAHAWMPTWGLAFIYLWHLLVLPAVTVLIAAGGMVNAWRALARRFSRRNNAAAPTPAELAKLLATPTTGGAGAVGGATLTRRQVLAAGAVAVPPLLTVAAVGRSLAQASTFRVRELVLPLAGLPRELDGLTIAHVSDVHVGRFTRAGQLPAIADATNKLKADLVLMTGDLIDLAIADLPVALDFVRKLDPRSGLFTVEGNHDLMEGADNFETRVRAAGVPLLLDETATVTLRGRAVQIMGLTWRRGEAGIVGAMSNLIPQRRADAFQILLAHHPHAFDPAAAVGIPLTLAGHTHGGQLMLTDKLGAGPMMYRYWSGEYRKKDSALVVSNGVGNWFPLRINAPAEIIHLTLRSAENAGVAGASRKVREIAAV
ncbi:MAG TPA: metallophosphoesterase [Tepidisphaeraceae bacterium]|nr:metallophosphoesterase [Tepidisphaeraceae bacterium]